MVSFTYHPRYKLSAKPLTPGQRVVFKRGKYKGIIRILVDLSWPGAFITSSVNGCGHVQHMCGEHPITDFIMPLREPSEN